MIVVKNETLYAFLLNKKEASVLSGRIFKKLIINNFRDTEM